MHCDLLERAAEFDKICKCVVDPRARCHEEDNFFRAERTRFIEDRFSMAGKPRLEHCVANYVAPSTRLGGSSSGIGGDALSSSGLAQVSQGVRLLAERLPCIFIGIHEVSGLRARG